MLCMLGCTIGPLALMEQAIGRASLPNGNLMTINSKLSSVDLFCGAGGFSIGFESAGYSSVYANDINKLALGSYSANITVGARVCGSIVELDPAQEFKGLLGRNEQVDALIGGPPCQGFSINAPERFVDDPRNSLFKGYLKYLDFLRPKCFAFENVPGMLSLDEGRIYKGIIGEFERRGYSVSSKVLLAAHYGVPQARYRLVILGTLLGSLKHPDPTHHYRAVANFTGSREMTVCTASRRKLKKAVTVGDAIGDLPPLAIGEGEEVSDYGDLQGKISKYALSLRHRGRLYNHVAARLGESNLRRLMHIPAGGSWRDIPHDLLPPGMKRAKRSDHTKRYGRLESNSLSGTVMTKCDPHWGAWFHYGQDRTLSAREAARIQSFPDSFRFLGPRTAQFEQIGNAVPPIMAKVIAQTLANHVGSFTEKQWRRAYQNYLGSPQTISR